MPREGVTLGQVEEAIDTLRGQDKKPSYRNIRSLIGEGSLTTIANHVKELERQRQLEAMPLGSDRPILADPVIKALHAGAEATWSELLAAADAVIEDHQQISVAAVAETKAIAEQAIEQRDNAETKNQELIKALQAKESELLSLSKSHDALGNQHQDLEKHLVVEQTTIKGLNNLVKELRGTIEQSKTEATNADRRTALIEERLAQAKRDHLGAIAVVKDESVDARQQLQSQMEQAQAQTDELRTTLSSQTTQIATLAAERDSERQVHKAVARHFDETKAELAQHIQSSNKHEGDVATLQERCVSLQATLAGEHEHRKELMAATDARIEEQAAVIDKLNDALERALLRRTDDEK